MVITAVDQAGQPWQQDKGYIYILQSSDNPVAEIISPEAPLGNDSVSISLPQTYASGKVWDDDGVRKIYWLLSKRDITSDILTPTSWLDNNKWLSRGWTKDNDGRIGVDDRDEASGVIDLPSEPTLYPWNFRTSSGEGDYKLYVIAVDKFGVVSLNKSPRLFRQETAEKPL